MMTQTAAAPIAFTSAGEAIFAAQSVAPGQPQPLGVLADGRPVWAVAPGAGPAGQPQPLGVLSDGRFIFGPGVVAADTKPLWKKKRVLIPAGFMALVVV